MTRPTIVFGREKKFRLGGTSFPTLEDFFLGPGSRTKYLYDTENRWIGENICNGSGLIEHETRFAYDGDEILMQFDEDFTTSVSSTYATNHPMSNANLSHRYLWQPDAVDQLMADEQVTTPGARGNVVYPLTDQLGTIHDLAVATLNSSTGLMNTAVVNHIVYDAFGNVVSSTNPSSLPNATCLFGYTGRPTDPAGTGLQNNLNRWYSPSAERWMSQDPLGYDGGDTNLYRYCGNDVTNTIDPSGLDRFIVIASDGHFYILVENPDKPGTYIALNWWPGGGFWWKTISTNVARKKGDGGLFFNSPYGDVVMATYGSNANQDRSLIAAWQAMAGKNDGNCWGWNWLWFATFPFANCATISAFMADYGGDYGNAVIKRTWWDDLVEWEAKNHKDFPADNPDRDYSQHHSFGGGF